MSNFVEDLLSGSGNLSGRSPDVTGSTWLNFFGDLPFSNNTSPDNALVGCVLNGSGAFVYDNSLVVGNWHDVNMKSSVPGSADYFVETTILFLDGGGFVSDAYSGSLTGRAVSPDSSGDSCGMKWDNAGANGDGTFDINVSWTTALDPDVPTGNTGSNWSTLTYGSATTLRVEFEGRDVRGYLNGVLMFTVTRGGSYYDAAGTAQWGFREYGSSGPQVNMEVQSLIAGYDFLTSPAGAFWTDKVKCTEVLA